MQEAPPDADHLVLRNTKLETLRLARGFTQQYVADSIGVDPTTLGRWEKNGEKVYAGKLRELAEFYHVPVEWLISPDPLVLHMHDYKVENGVNGAYNTVHMMPKELLESMEARYDKHISTLEQFMEKLMDLLGEKTRKSG